MISKYKNTKYVLFILVSYIILISHNVPLLRLFKVLTMIWYIVFELAHSMKVLILFYIVYDSQKQKISIRKVYANKNTVKK